MGGHTIEYDFSFKIVKGGCFNLKNALIDLGENPAVTSMIHGIKVFTTFCVPFLFLLDVLAMSEKRYEGIADATPSLMESCIAKELMEYFVKL